MDMQVFLTIIRQIALAVGAALVTKGFVDETTLQAIVGGLVAVVSVVWGIVAKSKDQAVIKAAKE